MSDESVTSVATTEVPSPETDSTSPNGHAGDSNDYSRFDELSDSDDDEEAEAASSVDCAEKLQQIGAAKVAGNGFVAKAEWKKAAQQYRKGLKVTTFSEMDQKQSRADR